MLLNEFFNQPEGDSYANNQATSTATQNKRPQTPTNEHIVKVKDGYRLVSKKTGKNLGTYPTRAGAEKRERQVQYFKHMSEDNHMADVVAARQLANAAIRNPQARQEYFDFLKHLREKHGKEYSTQVHQHATNLDEDAWHSPELDSWHDGQDAWHGSDDGGSSGGGAGGGGGASLPSMSSPAAPSGVAPTGVAPITEPKENPVDQKTLDAIAAELDEDFNPEDTITVDVPLFIRLLEYAREDAKTDMDLHKVTEKITALSAQGRTLSMDDYNKICSTKE